MDRKKMQTWVLRLGHRVQRDERISTHVGLVARAFGADKLIYSGEKDERLLRSIEEVVDRWGGDFQVEYQKNGKQVIREFENETVLLSMYGIHLKKGVREVHRKTENTLLIVVGGEKVPGEIYGMVDINISVTNQPHSEVAALAVFLHELYRGKELDKKFEGAHLKVVPQKRGKKIKEIDS